MQMEHETLTNAIKADKEKSAATATALKSAAAIGGVLAGAFALVKTLGSSSGFVSGATACLSSNPVTAGVVAAAAAATVVVTCGKSIVKTGASLVKKGVSIIKSCWNGICSAVRSAWDWCFG